MQTVAPLKKSLEAKMPEALHMLKEMVVINSYTENREGVNRLAKYTAKCFEPLGFIPEFVPSIIPQFGDHLIMTQPGRSRRCIGMISHLDTVFPPAEEVRNHFHWQPEGDRIYGPGTVDIKGGTIMMWLVLSALREHAPEVFGNITWKLFWNSSEERLTPDLAQLCRSRLDRNTLAALVFEAEGRLGDQRLLVVSRKGRATWRATVTGRGAHAGGKHSHGANAIVQLGKTIQQIAALTNYSQGLTFNVGHVSGGSVLNRVPHSAVAEGEFRAFNPEAFVRGKEALLSLGGPGEVHSPVDGYACQVKVEVFDETAPWPHKPETSRLFSLWRQAGDELSIAVAEEQRGGLSDGNLLWDSVPTLDGLGPWGDNDHCSERSPDGSKLPEFVDVTSFVPKAMLNFCAILKLYAAENE
jgi:glutamate carboxypeptidase